MSKINRVIESKHWYNIKTGATASIYGALPWVSSEEKANWEVRTRGWTWEVVSHTGSVTVGFGRIPAPTKEIATAIMTAFNELNFDGCRLIRGLYGG